MMYRAPNESHYLANLNAINPIQTSPGSVSQAFDDSFPNDDDLDIFASTQFFDFDNMAETMVGGGGGGVKEEVAKTTITTIPNNSNVAIATSIGRSGMGYLEDLNGKELVFPMYMSPIILISRKKKCRSRKD